MDANTIKLIHRSSAMILLTLLITSCVTTPTPPGPSADEVTNIQVQPTENVETEGVTEEITLPNCGGTSDLTRSLASQSGLKKSVTIGSKASGSAGAEVGVSAVAKAKLEAAVEQAYQQTYETTVMQVKAVQMQAAPASHVVYVIQWKGQRFESMVSYDAAGETYNAPYAFVISFPDVISSYQVPCTSTDTPTDIPTSTEIPSTETPTETLTPTKIIPTNTLTDTPTPTEIVPTSKPTEAEVPLRIISIQGNARIKDDESWPMSDEFGDLSIPLQAVTLSPLTRHPLQFEKCVGGEVRLEIDIDVYLKEDLTAEIKIDARLYEGTRCSTDDREDTVSQVVYARPDGSPVSWSYTLRNTENNGGDSATINLTFTNNTP